MHRKTLQNTSLTNFNKTYIVLLSWSNFKKEHDFLLEYEQLITEKTLNRKLW